MNRGRFIIGALLGAAAGVVAGLLTAPKSGRETRADLKGKAAELKESAARKSDEIRHRGKKGLDDARETVDEYKDRGEKTVKDARHRFDKKDE